MTRSVPPAPDEPEISVFGPGFGECIVVHLGAGDWMIVDSCAEVGSRIPVALQYLRGMGVDVASAVKLVVVSHWHDDHMRGAANIVSECGAAVFVCSAALNKREFYTLVAADGDLHAMSPDTRSLSELAGIMETLRARSDSPHWAVENLPLFRRDAGNGLPPAAVHALSPAQAVLTNAFEGIAGMLPRAGQTKLAHVSLDPNEVAVVLLVEVGDFRALLGADLETGRNASRGWHAVLSNPLRPSGSASVYKVAHHGSKTGDHERIWTDLLSAGPIAVLTPFSRGNVSLPTSGDVDRIRARASQVLCASSPRPVAGGSRNRTVERTIREVARSFRQRTGRMGQIRVRQSTAAPRVELFDAAIEMCLPTAACGQHNLPRPCPHPRSVHRRRRERPRTPSRSWWSPLPTSWRIELQQGSWKH